MVEAPAAPDRASGHPGGDPVALRDGDSGAVASVGRSRERARTDRPIGVFDSGVGGLTVLKALVSELPSEDFLYLGDTARLPYGTKSAGTVARYSVQAAQALAGRGVKCLVVACNTASSVGLPGIRERLEGMPVIGVIEPGAEAACAVSRSGCIAVIATEGTVNGGAYQQAILRYRGDARVTARPAPLFVALAEEGLCDGPIPESVARHYLEPLLRSDDGGAPAGRCAPDTLVLGCTHFPMLAGAIGRVAGSQVQIIDSAVTAARAVRKVLREGGLARSAGMPHNLRGLIHFLATDSAERFMRIGSRFLERPIAAGDIELIDL